MLVASYLVAMKANINLKVLGSMGYGGKSVEFVQLDYRIY
jgi:hypothetical protein